MLGILPTQTARLLRGPGVVLFAAIALLCLPQAASAESATKNSVVEIPLGSAGKLLRQKAIKQRAIKPAKVKNSRLVLPVSDVSISSATKASVILRGGIKLSRGRHSIKLQGLMVKVSGRNLTVDGRVNGKRLKLFSGRASSPLVGASIHQVSAAAVNYKSATSGAKAIRRALKLKKSPFGKLGSATVFVRVKLPTEQGGSGTLQDLAGPRLARPTSAVDVTASSLKWWIRDSWIRYLPFNLPQDGATGDAPTQNHVCKDNWAPQSDVYAYNLPFTSGWWDAASGTGAFYYSGAVRWFFPENGIDIIASGAEIEINGASSRVIFRFDDIPAGTARRGAFVSLDVGSPMNSVALAPGGASSRLKATILTDPATSPFGGFVTQYQSVPGWGCFDLGFSL